MVLEMARTRFTLHGPVAAVLNVGVRDSPSHADSGDLGNQQTAANSNQTSIWSRIENQGLKLLAESQQKKIIKLLIQLEQESNQILLQELTPVQRKNYERLVGPPLGMERGNLEIHLALAKRPKIWPAN